LSNSLASSKLLSENKLSLTLEKKVLVNQNTLNVKSLEALPQAIIASKCLLDSTNIPVKLKPTLFPAIHYKVPQPKDEH
jgi:hypothetical protein